jgi:DNA-binding GntR family transcriptional regulator
MILSGELSMGARLDERVLAERLAVSRTPVREAINRLVQDRIVVREPYRGNFVAELSPSEVSNVYIVRQELEGLAMRLALPRMSDVDLQRCVQLVRSGDEALEMGDIVAYGEFDRQLHEFIIDKSANESLRHVLESLSREIQLVRAFGNRQPHVAEDAATSRHALLEAMLRRDADAASALLEEHIDEVRLAVIGNLADDESASLKRALNS